MNHADHVNLIRAGVLATDGAPGPERVWADFGSGTGAFTFALAELLGGPGRAPFAPPRGQAAAPSAVIYSVDKDRGALEQQARDMRGRFPEVDVHYVSADFTRPIQLPPLNGILAANSLHFQRDKDRVVRLWRGYLKPGGCLIVVEYNIERGNFAVPYPISFAGWQALARRSGFGETRLLATRPSRFLNEFYSAVSE